MDTDTIRRTPKVVLHDHLDGGLRPATVVELADAVGHTLPAEGTDALARWFVTRGDDADLVTYLAGFEHTVAVLQTETALARVARECAEDLAADGIVHAEVRYALELSTAGGLSMDQVLEAILAGFAAGPAEIDVRLLVCAIRSAGHAEAAFAAAVRHRDAGVVGIDLAGPEAGYPAADHARAITAAREAGLGVTLHAGEADGPSSVADALDQGATRLGHGVRIVEDLDGNDRPGAVASRVLEGAVPLEVCPTSNVHTGIAPDLATHPFARLRRAGFALTVNTDNRLMSDVTLSGEFAALTEAFGDEFVDVDALTRSAANAAFLDEHERTALHARLDAGGLQRM